MEKAGQQSDLVTRRTSLMKQASRIFDRRLAGFPRDSPPRKCSFHLRVTGEDGASWVSFGQHREQRLVSKCGQAQVDRNFLSFAITGLERAATPNSDSLAQS